MTNIFFLMWRNSKFNIIPFARNESKKNTIFITRENISKNVDLNMRLTICPFTQETRTYEL